MKVVILIVAYATLALAYPRPQEQPAEVPATIKQVPATSDNKQPEVPALVDTKLIPAIPEEKSAQPLPVAQADAPAKVEKEEVKPAVMADSPAVKSADVIAPKANAEPKPTELKAETSTSELKPEQKSAESKPDTPAEIKSPEQPSEIRNSHPAEVKTEEKSAVAVAAKEPLSESEHASQPKEALEHAQQQDTITTAKVERAAEPAVLNTSAKVPEAQKPEEKMQEASDGAGKSVETSNVMQIPLKTAAPAVQPAPVEEKISIVEAVKQPASLADDNSQLVPKQAPAIPPKKEDEKQLPTSETKPEIKSPASEVKSVESKTSESKVTDESKSTNSQSTSSEENLKVLPPQSEIKEVSTSTESKESEEKLPKSEKKPEIKEQKPAIANV